MRYSKHFGLFDRHQNWVPAPRYIIRRSIVLELMKGLHPGPLLEVGCGSGALLFDLARLGFNGWGIEESSQALELAHSFLKDTPLMNVSQEISLRLSGTFSYLLSFEVLEHIEDDLGQMQYWHSLLADNGTLVFSVPYGKEKWGAGDVWAGHYRRYEHQDIQEKLAQAGFTLKKTISYGGLLRLLIHPSRIIYYFWKNRSDPYRHIANAQSRKREQSSRSGSERSIERLAFPLYNNWIGAVIFSWIGHLERKFPGWRLHDGIIVIASKSQPLSRPTP